MASRSLRIPISPTAPLLEDSSMSSPGNQFFRDLIRTFPAECGDFDRDKLLRYARKIVNDPDRAEDVVSEAMSKGYNAYLVGTGNQTGSFQGWMYRIIHNCCIDHLRRNNMSYLFDGMVSLPDDEQVQSIEARLHDDVLSQQILKAARRFDQRSRSSYKLEGVLWLDSTGVPLRDIAELMGYENFSAFRSWYFRAKKALKSQLEERGIVA